MPFRTADGGIVVPTVTSEEMRRVDRLAVEEFGLGLLQMMENAGRSLAENVLAMLGGAGDGVTVLAGSGGNGGGGLCCARHLHNRGMDIQVLLDRDPDALGSAARTQLRILEAAGVHPLDYPQAAEVISQSRLVVDALIGYGLQGAPRGRTAELISLCRERVQCVLSLDVPSGMDATTGLAPGPVIRPDRTLTLALSKAGLNRVPGEIYLADIGIPSAVFGRLGLHFESPFRESYWIRLVARDEPAHGEAMG